MTQRVLETMDVRMDRKQDKGNTKKGVIMFNVWSSFVTVKLGLLLTDCSDEVWNESRAIIVTLTQSHTTNAP